VGCGVRGCRRVGESREEREDRGEGGEEEREERRRGEGEMGERGETLAVSKPEVSRTASLLCLRGVVSIGGCFFLSPVEGDGCILNRH
jgi:hypothetical protein